MISCMKKTRPDLWFLINRAAQVTSDTFFHENIKDFNKAVKMSIEKAIMGPQFPSLSTKPLKMKVYFDSSFEINDDLCWVMSGVSS